MAFKKIIGTKAEVFSGTAMHTTGGLYKSDLTKSKWGKVVSKKKQQLGKKLARQYPPQNTKAPAFRKSFF